MSAAISALLGMVPPLCRERGGDLFQIHPMPALEGQDSNPVLLGMVAHTQPDTHTGGI